MKQKKSTQGNQRATFGAGCFWHVELAFGKLKGVLSTKVGYAGGTTENPTYEDVCTGKTGHAEVVQLEFDSTKTSYEDLLDFFWQMHNPTLLNRQGPDVGTQYRSLILFHNPDQEKKALMSLQNLQETVYPDKPVVTQVIPATAFYQAEDYHQKYLEKRGLSHC